MAKKKQVSRKSSAQKAVKSKASVGKTAGPKTTLPIDFDQLKDLFELMNEHGMGEIKWGSAGQEIAIKARNQGSGAVVAPAMEVPKAMPVVNAPLPVDTAVAASASAKAALSTQQKEITSPFVGTFYRSASPESDPYVKEGQPIAPGDVLCIVEAMKLMNEIEAELKGKIISVLVENGQPVEFGEPLFVVDTSA